MQIDANKGTASSGKVSINDASLSNTLRTGQVISARVTTVASVSSTQNNYVVNINNQLVELSSSLSFKQGQILALKVQQTQPKLILEIVEQKQPQATLDASKPINASLRQLIPRQQGLQYLTSAMLQLAASSGMPRNIEQALQQLSQALSQSGDLQSPGKVAEAIRNSGLFMESALVSGKGLPAGDMKLLWLTLLTRAGQYLQQTGTVPSALPDRESNTPLPFVHGVGVQQRIPVKAGSQATKSLDVLILKLFGLAESAVSRISLNQVNSAEAQQAGDARWKLEVPVLFPNQELCVVEFLIERDIPERDKTEDTVVETRWSLSFALDMPALGPLMVKLVLSGESIEVRIHAEQEATAQQVTDHLDQLGARLATQGMDVTNLSCHQGIPVRNETMGQSNMLDIRA